MKVRESNFELLRIICMYMIIVHHVLVYGIRLDTLNINSVNFIVCNFLNSITIVAVNVYVLISGYFMIENKFKWNKVIKLHGKVLFYSLSISIIFWLFRLEEFNLISLFKSLLPIITFQWWFISYYLVLYILSPYINKMLNQLNTKEFNILIIILICIFVIWPTGAVFIGTINPVSSRTGYDLFNFLLFYVCGAYIKKNDIKIINKYYYLFSYIFCAVILSLINFFISDYKNKFSDIYNYNFIIIYIASISMFLFFKKIKISNNYSEKINSIASMTLSVYLIHEQRMIREVIYNLFKNEKILNNLIFIAYLIIGSMIIFFVCIIIDKVRMYTYYVVKLIFCKKYKH
ncbi:acyltransferase family protein [Clostridium sp. SHJSY1]|uniref:acyltransferase n=1 Tax=Clostridium sp. SHJSY1 TaxID=2942483 RepID=UPI002876531E|nr:acyltransferase family protein [Clostridium sp. SHJSY1]MDS0526648.1 acyltransferase family protein [Clostridium sp. SHJSY1]